jgi:dihydrofolate synthase/folylpolyglutamate synthase
MADKDVAGLIGGLAAAAALRGALVVCTTVDAPRALPAEGLAARWRGIAPGVRVAVAADPDAALAQALQAGGGPIVVAGSLYLVGAVRARLVDDPALRDP